MIDLLFADGLFNVDSLAVDNVVILLNGLIHRVVVVKLDESESPAFAGVLFRQSGDLCHRAELREILLEIVILNIFLESSDEDLLDGLSGLGLGELFPGRGSFRFHGLAVDDVGPLILTRVNRFQVGESDESKSTRSASYLTD